MCQSRSVGCVGLVLEVLISFGLGPITLGVGVGHVNGLGLQSWFQYRFFLSQVKWNLISKVTNFVFELPQELPKYLRLRILGNQEILENSQIWLET